jgi:thioredoxin reductase (NADPH)
MITSDLLKGTRLFASLAEEELAQLSGAAADVSLQPEEWLVREGEKLDFFVVLEGALELSKEIMGRQVVMARLGRGDYFGEVSTLFGVPSLSSLRATSKCRLAQFGAQLLQELVQGPACGATILKTLKERLAESGKHALELPSARVQVIGSQLDTDLSDIRAFLRLNRIPYEWIDRERQPGRVPVSIDDGPAVVVDGKISLKQPLTIKKVAEALGMSTRPIKEAYDLVVVGGGPAGLAAAVYGASEGLSVLLIERKLSVAKPEPRHASRITWASPMVSLVMT